PTLTTNVTYTYTVPKHYDVGQLVKSSLGCQIAFYRHIIMLPGAAPTTTIPYSEDFELTSGNWQTGRDTVNINGNNSLGPNRYNDDPRGFLKSSWKRGLAANKTTIKNDPAVVDLKNGSIEGNG